MAERSRSYNVRNVVNWHVRRLLEHRTGAGADGRPRDHREVVMGEAISTGWYEILKFVGPPAAVAIIFFWQYCRFANRVLDRVDKRETTLLDFVDKHAGASATTTEINRTLCEQVGENTTAVNSLGEKISLLTQKVGE